VICLLAGAFGGFFWGHKVASEAAAAVAQMRSTADRLDKAVNQAGSDLKKGV
jgi:hypothetical protein